MKHQITIIGGQTVPVYLGIKEKKPKVVHTLYTKDTKSQASIFKNLFPSIEFRSYQVHPFSFKEIKNTVETIIIENPECDFELNLTGGTKLMALASHDIIKSHGFNSFYIDQKFRFFDFSSQLYTRIESLINLDTFIKLSGHNKYESSELNDYTDEEQKLARKINSISKSTAFKQAIKSVQKNCDDISKCQEFSFADKNFRLSWKSPNFSLEFNNYKIFSVSKKSFKIAFNGIWWEIIVANSIRNWKKAYELKLNLEVHSKKAYKFVKNEIDIVINTGSKMIFLECKSGNIKQDDINKIRTVKKLYGGISTKSILISKYKPHPNIIEKCSDLDIDIYTDYDGLKNLMNKLDSLLLKMEL